ncbi:acid phosphatase [Legionella israelensis]|uniref:Acid phosphatase n=1 Tax=Legionella israelensis TaxID=454 RepID=A0AAX1EE27_9GAMM|nr:HAD family acid phosphatase [Legionella israelensis]QBR83358.1 acid phosphatase [Legionella israelensis]
MKNTLPCIRQFFLTLFFASLFYQVSYAEPYNLGLAKQMLIQYHDSGAYQQELTRAIDRAHQLILQQAKHYRKGQKLAIVLDIDETSLSNYKYLLQRDFSNNPKQVHQEILKADAPAILPMRALYNDAIKHGIHVFFITGRTEDERTATIKNLHKAGYRNWSGLYLKSNAQKTIPALRYKTQKRAEITQKGYIIIASIGDQVSDIEGGYTQMGFKLPNPFYYLS